jgi:hypothetical protein
MITRVFMSPEYELAASLSKKMSPDGPGRYQAEKIVPAFLKVRNSASWQ